MPHPDVHPGCLPVGGTDMNGSVLVKVKGLRRVLEPAQILPNMTILNRDLVTPYKLFASGCSYERVKGTKDVLHFEEDATEKGAFPCGHSFSTDGMAAYLVNMTTNGNATKCITCPECRAKLNLLDCCRLANGEEPGSENTPFKKCQSILYKRGLVGPDGMRLRECEGCKTLLYHQPQNYNKFRCKLCVERVKDDVKSKPPKKSSKPIGKIASAIRAAREKAEKRAPRKSRTNSNPRPGTKVNPNKVRVDKALARLHGQKFRRMGALDRTPELGRQPAGVSREVGYKCWECQLPWRSNSDNECGNPGCGGTMARIKQACKLVSAIKTQTQIGSVTCPEVRACPRCATVIGHHSACKHMTCGRNGHSGQWIQKTGCSYQFCFICLQEWGNHNNSRCQVAPMQTMRDLEKCSDIWLRGGETIKLIPRMHSDDILYNFVNPRPANQRGGHDQWRGGRNDW